MASRFPSPITTEDYERMIDQGLLTDCDRVELIEGEIVEKVTPGDPHAMCVLVLTQLFRFRAPDDLVIGVQGPLWLPPDSVPEPAPPEGWRKGGRTPSWGHEDILVRGESVAPAVCPGTRLTIDEILADVPPGRMVGRSHAY